mmetsp:Transcript_9724/g.17408  ORF Transcript_9724/g.17408 Transcript_9724/m.17408 type:complete len:80 (+) Transcript_9724:6-245(+)
MNLLLKRLTFKEAEEFSCRPQVQDTPIGKKQQSLAHCIWKQFRTNVAREMCAYFQTAKIPFFCVLSLEKAARMDGLNGW